ncbi:MAG: glutamine--tRNA ligase, partial [Sphingobacteriaceae bacterium]|nr:glutamine--tRNA ligase [Cytophagaceae bacterium]
LLLDEMRRGLHLDGSHVLRAKIDMADPNMKLRDPLMYRIRHAHHHRTGDKWCIYPMYDFAHGQSDAIEGITHSSCTLEFIPHRPLYDWFIEKLGILPSRQIEFARLNLTYTVMSKRKLLQLVNENHVTGWDDPRMPTLSGVRRRGYPAVALREFCERIGVAKRDNLIDIGLLEFFVRENLNKTATRVMAVVDNDPIRVTLTNYPEGQTEWLSTENNPENPDAGSRDLPFSRELLIEREDFMENPPKKFFRLAPGGLVRLKSAYIIRCDEVLKDSEGKVTEVRCTYIPESKSGGDTSGLKVQGTLHWVSAAEAVAVDVRNYDRLFQVEDLSAAEGDFKEYLNPDSLAVVKAYAEPSLLAAAPGQPYQFMRKGYYCLDVDSTPGSLVFNRTVTLKDSWKPPGK